MKSSWNDADARVCTHDPVALRVYTSRLLGKETSLVLHGGGNTSVKAMRTSLLGEPEECLYVKGSGWDLATLEPQGLVPVRLAPLKKAVQLDALSDTDMVRLQRSAMPDPGMAAPSVEAILHALIPYTFVDHTHADAIVTLTNTPQGERMIRELYGPRVLIVPYIMPGFILAKKIHELTQSADWSQWDGMILLNHGVFTFSNNARESYERMLEFVTRAEEYLKHHAPYASPVSKLPSTPLTDLAHLRQVVSLASGTPRLVRWDTDALALDFSNHPQLANISQRGPLTPDHVIRTKRVPVILDSDFKPAVKDYTAAYQAYFARHACPGLRPLNPAPAWGVWRGRGVVSLGRSVKETKILSDILAHTLPAILAAETLGGWAPVTEKDAFDMEYWELEQAKLKTSTNIPEFQGKIALVTGAAHGIGRACVEALWAQGAVVAALDIAPELVGTFNRPEILELVCDVTDTAKLTEAVHTTVRRFGGLDIVVSNAGIFPPSQAIEAMDASAWDKSLRLNLTSHQQLLQLCIPFLKYGCDPAVVFVASKNVPAPGPGASAYSVAKAGLTQLARVAALELAGDGIRVNTLHPNAVFDTKLWTSEVLEQRAKHYGMSVQEYKTNNLMKVEITSADVARLACALAGQAFAKTTGAQVPIDGGNDRVI